MTASEEVPEGKILVITQKIEGSFYLDQPNTREEWAQFFTELLDRELTFSELLLAFTPTAYALLELETYNPPLH